VVAAAAAADGGGGFFASKALPSGDDGFGFGFGFADVKGRLPADLGGEEGEGPGAPRREEVEEAPLPAPPPPPPERRPADAPTRRIVESSRKWLSTRAFFG